MRLRTSLPGSQWLLGAEHAARGPEGWSHGVSVSRWAMVGEVSWVLPAVMQLRKQGASASRWEGASGGGSKGPGGSLRGARAPALSLAWDSVFSSKLPALLQGHAQDNVDLTAEQEAPHPHGAPGTWVTACLAYLIPPAGGTVSISPTWERTCVCPACSVWPLGFPPGHRTFPKGEDSRGRGSRKLKEGWEGGSRVPVSLVGAFRTTQALLLERWPGGVTLAWTYQRQFGNPRRWASCRGGS